MIAAILSALLLQGVQTSHSAQCLAEVAAFAQERLDVTDGVQLQALSDRTDRLMVMSAELTKLQADMIQAQDAALAEIVEKTARGELPLGSADLYKRQAAEQRAPYEAHLRQLRTFSPSCAWPGPTQHSPEAAPG